MKTDKDIKICKNIRTRLYNFFGRTIGNDADWISNHIAHCTRCQQRIASLGRIQLALILVKTQMHSPALLKDANSMAISVLSKKVRNSSKAQKLRSIQPAPTLFEKAGRYRSSLLNAAACLAILILLKIGIFSSMESFNSRSEQALKQYYAKNIGDELTDEIFPA